MVIIIIYLIGFIFTLYTYIKKEDGYPIADVIAAFLWPITMLVTYIKTQLKD